MKKKSGNPFFIRLFHWEYWPFNVVYGPVYIYWLWLCIKARSFFFFNASNPTIKNGGFLLESKKEIYDLIPSHYYPKTILCPKGIDAGKLLQLLAEANFAFPLIGKPDIGMRGLSVKKLENREEVLDYALNSNVSFLVQEFIPFENEVGIFYYRLPGEVRGRITGIVGKEFLAVTGDGKHTIEKLLQQDDRFVLQLDTLKRTLGAEIQTVPAKGENRLLVPYGNHSRGAKFLDVSALIDDELTQSVDNICQQVSGFYYGRLDIKYNTWQELKQGRNFSIIELNGAGSEPTHMYDPKHSIFFAWKEIIRHWNILLKISMHNHRHANVPYMRFKAGIKMFKENGTYVKMIEPQKQAIA